LKLRQLSVDEKSWELFSREDFFGCMSFENRGTQNPGEVWERVVSACPGLAAVAHPKRLCPGQGRRSPCARRSSTLEDFDGAAKR